MEDYILLAPSTTGKHGFRGAKYQNNTINSLRSVYSKVHISLKLYFIDFQRIISCPYCFLFVWKFLGFIFICVVCVYAVCVGVLWRPEEGVRDPFELELQEDVNHLV